MAESNGFSMISRQVTRQSEYDGTNPGKLMTASLGLYMGMHAVTYLTKNKLEFNVLEITVDTESTGNPA